MKGKMLAVRAVALALFLLVMSQGSAFADTFKVMLNTSGLGSGASEIFFFLIGTGANTAIISNISLGGGTAGSVDTANAAGSGVSGTNNLTSAISLVDNLDFLNIYAQSFQAGGSLSFLLDLTTNVVSPAPGQFSFALLDPGGNPIPTSDPNGSDNLFAIDIDSQKLTPAIYSDLVIAAAPAPVPEAPSLLLLGSCLLPLALLWRIQKKRYPSDSYSGALKRVAIAKGYPMSDEF